MGMNKELENELINAVNERNKNSRWGHHIKGYLCVNIETWNGIRRYRYSIFNFKSFTNSSATNKLKKGKHLLTLKEVREWCKELGVKKTSNMKYLDCVKTIMSTDA